MPARPDRAAPPRVLVVDDADINRALLCLQLRRAGCVADEAADGATALAALAVHAYDLVFMDGMMPVLDGYQASAAWRRVESAASRPRVCIVGLSADGPDGPADWRAAGMDAMLAKPLGAAALALLLRDRLAWP